MVKFKSFYMDKYLLNVEVFKFQTYTLTYQWRCWRMLRYFEISCLNLRSLFHVITNDS